MSRLGDLLAGRTPDIPGTREPRYEPPDPPWRSAYPPRPAAPQLPREASAERLRVSERACARYLKERPYKPEPPRGLTRAIDYTRPLELEAERDDPEEHWPALLRSDTEDQD